MPDLSSSEDDDRYNRVDGDEGWRQEVDSLEETLGTLGLEERVARRRREDDERREGGRDKVPRLESRGGTSRGALPGGKICSKSCAVDINNFSGAGGAARRRKELKFSWDDRVKHEDWGIQKVVMMKILLF